MELSMPVVWSDRCLLHDPGSPLEVTSAGFREAGRLLGGLRLPTVLVQEGGYHDAIGERVRETLLGFEGRS